MDKFPFSDLPLGPLTADDIAYIEETLDMLIHELFDDPVRRQEALSDDLIVKLQGYIEIADYSLTQPYLAGDAKILAALLRNVLEKVEAYYLSLN